MEKRTLSIQSKYKKYSRVFVVMFTFLIWRQMTLIIMDNLVKNILINELRLLMYAVYYISVVGLALIGSILFDKRRGLYFRLWPIFAVISSSVIVLFGFNLESNLCHLFFAGLSVGLGIPVCLAFFADNTVVENRGRVGAIIFFIIILSFTLLGIVANLITIEAFSQLSLLWALLSLIIFSFLKVIRPTFTTKTKISFKNILANKHFILYFTSWSMFCFIDLFEGPILRQHLTKNFQANFMNSLRSIETTITSFTTLLAGFLIDSYGRKKILIYGFITLGIAYATIGVFPHSQILWILYSAINGIALGVFIVTFVFTIWGDLSPRGLREKYYALGSIPFFLIIFIQRLITPYILEIPVHAAFSFASFFLFLAVWPLVNASETLPEKVIRHREMKEYVEKAKKIREKYVRES